MNGNRDFCKIANKNIIDIIFKYAQKNKLESWFIQNLIDNIIEKSNKYHKDDADVCIGNKLIDLAYMCVGNEKDFKSLQKELDSMLDNVMNDILKEDSKNDA